MWMRESHCSQGLIPLPPLALAPKWEGKKIASPVSGGKRKDQRAHCFTEALWGNCACGSPTPTWSSQDSEETSVGFRYLSGFSQRNSCHLVCQSADLSGHIRACREIQEAVPVCKGRMRTSFVEESRQWRWRKESRFERCLEVGQKDHNGTVGEGARRRGATVDPRRLVWAAEWPKCNLPRWGRQGRVHARPGPQWDGWSACLRHQIRGCATKPQ